MTEKSAQFIINFDDFVSIKKLKIESKTTIEDIIEYLASVQFTSASQIKEHLEKLVNIEDLKKQIEYLLDLTFEEFYKELNSRKVKMLLKKLLPKHIVKKQKDAYIQALKVYILNLFCVKHKLIMNYEQIPFPSKKKMMKTKNKKK